MEFSKYQHLYDKLCGAHPDNFHTQGQAEVWAETFQDKDFTIFERVVSKAIKTDKFPSINYAITVYKSFSGEKKQADYDREKYGAIQFPEMSDEEALEEYELMKSFFDAYPCPDIPLGATQAHCQAIEDGYHRLMRKAGINPKEVTHPKVARMLMRDLNKTLPNGGFKETMGWKESLENYKTNQSRDDLKEAKRLVMEGM